MYESLAILAVFAVLYSIFAGAVDRTWISSAIVFTGFGLLVGPVGFDVLPLVADIEMIKQLAELTLAVVLFIDAASANLNILISIKRVPIRLILLGLPLTIVLGYLTGILIFPDMPLLMVALLATILAPTDAALGKPVITNPAVPVKLREALNVESGLNDGVCVPILLLLLALATGEQSGAEDTGLFTLDLFIEEIGIGLLSGIGLTLIIAVLGRFADNRGWIDPVWSMFTVATLALACFGLARALGGSGFIAAFAGGLSLNWFFRNEETRQWLANAEGYGDLFSLVTWSTFGALVLGATLQHATLPMLLYAVLSLTVIRMLPVFLVLSGSNLSTEAKLFIGWFGPRGLASVVFTIVVLDTALPDAQQIVYIATLTILLSILLHGVTAMPWAKGFGRREQQRAAHK